MSEPVCEPKFERVENVTEHPRPLDRVALVVSALVSRRVGQGVGDGVQPAVQSTTG